jgi:hypothetical protein
MRLRTITVGIILCLALLVAAPAYAQTAAQSGYGRPAGSVQELLSTKKKHKTPTPPSPTHEAGKLPFTGLDLAMVVAAGGVLLAMGFGIRRLSRSEIA